MVSYHIGIDVHRRSWMVCILHLGQRVFRGAIPPDVDGLVDVLRKSGAVHSNSKCVYEIGPSGFWIYDQLKAKGFDVIVVAPSKVPRDPSSRVKTDRRDSLELAQWLMSGHLRSIHIPDHHQRSLRGLVRTRRRLVEQRAKAVKSIKSRLTYLGIDYGIRGWSGSFKKWLRDLPLIAGHRVSIDVQIRLAEAIEEQIEELEQHLDQALKTSALPGYELYASVPSFQLVTIAVLMAELGDLRRFTTSEQLVAYLGLCPSEHSSGETIKRGRITRDGNVLARNTLVEAAWRLSRIDPELRKFYFRISARGNSKKAVVAVARKLATILWAMFQSGERFRKSEAA